eukprot:CAMPEP_0194185106 /NCGR_PEP_ID=MMETSP0154-20130528/41064_1 /TAXON_ID=1049557 /ORGANISM="Thalassiothrix antarctica, Strain L6-D1" /LENGTH=392 /DNA_ID=CAMNT_0038903183 /DNA_START=18 /DNA_END=1196 /DNA_ORIENTATION=-
MPLLLRHSILLVAQVIILTTLDSARGETLDRNNDPSSQLRRRLLLDPRSVEAKTNEHFADRLLESYQPEPTTKVYDVRENYWCKPAQLPPIDYHSCDKKRVMNAIPLHAELTDKFMLLSVIKSIEQENACYFIDETESRFPEHSGSFLENYLEPIGLAADSVDVMLANKKKMIEIMPRANVWNNAEDRRVENTINTIEALQYHNVEGHELKRNILKRIWRPIPKLRDDTCTKLQDHIKGEEYLAISINKCYDTTGEYDERYQYFIDDYVQKIDEIVQLHFGGINPLIFAATDSCEYVEKIRERRSDFRIISECDRNSHDYTRRYQTEWTREEIEQNYEKYFVELFAMAGAKVLIGVSCTNISWFAYFMREKTEHKTFYVLEPNGPSGVPMQW